MNKTKSRPGKTASPAAGTQGQSPAGASSTKPGKSGSQIKIPPLLLEGDDPPEPAPSSPKYALGLGPVPEAPPSEQRQLPEAYGTEKLLLLVRDPHWLFAHWDLTLQQQRGYNALSADHHLILRVQTSEPGSTPKEIHVHPESRHWFVEVQTSGREYIAELGYYQPDRHWVQVALSNRVRTPSGTVAEERSVAFGSVGGGPLPVARATVEGALHVPTELPPTSVTPPRVEWIPALDSDPAKPAAVQPWGPQSEAITGMPPAGGWSPEQEQGLTEFLDPQSFHIRSISSLDIIEGVRREVLREIAALQPGQPVPALPSSPLGLEQPQLKAFWFSLNAELVIYGATEPNATLTIGGRPIKLSPDGHFSCRFALPDGEYELEVSAASADQEVRSAKLKFKRHTQRSGDVGAHPQQPLPTPG
jgi:hypothetical protein